MSEKENTVLSQNAELKSNVLKLYDKGEKIVTIAEEFDLERSTIIEWINNRELLWKPVIKSSKNLKAESKENPLGVSWHDSAWIPVLNATNVMDYFSERSNPFFDRTCNNEIVKMQRLNPEQLANMTGTEYILLHVQEPILYVIRKQHRSSPATVIPLADYYICAGIVYQAPDLASVINSRLLSAAHHLQSAFEELSTSSRYHPSKGYSWDFKNGKSLATKKEIPVREECSSLFQRQRVDMLLAELTRKFPIPVPKPTQPTPTEPQVEVKQEVKTEKKDMKPPPEKKARLN